ncbi:MAG: hypothetical protein M3R17_04830 [Bacteroidota bacterium]|nr:hypothetical protein [Bacteroidota bacterium]
MKIIVFFLFLILWTSGQASRPLSGQKLLLQFESGRELAKDGDENHRLFIFNSVTKRPGFPTAVGTKAATPVRIWTGPLKRR